VENDAEIDYADIAENKGLIWKGDKSSG